MLAKAHGTLESGFPPTEGKACPVGNPVPPYVRRHSTTATGASESSPLSEGAECVAQFKQLLSELALGLSGWQPHWGKGFPQ